MATTEPGEMIVRMHDVMATSGFVLWYVHFIFVFNCNKPYYIPAKTNKIITW